MSPLQIMAQKRGVTVEQIRAERQAAREAIEAPRHEAAAKRAEARRLLRELRGEPTKANPVKPLTLDEQLEVLRAAVAARRDGDTRAHDTLIREATAIVKARRPLPPPRPER